MTARSFLFPPNDADIALTRLLARAAEVTGFLKGAPGSHKPGWYRHGLDNGPMLRDLYDALAQAYPAGGPAFWALRLWTNLLWQPAYLAVIAVHGHGAVPDLRAMAQCRQLLDINGFRLPPGPQRQGEVEAMIGWAAADLRATAETLLEEINAIVRFKPVPAQRLLAARVLGVVALLERMQPGISPDEISRHAQSWLAALDLVGQGTLEPVVLTDGRQKLVLARKGCCLDYLVWPDRLCASCPKQTRAVRLARQCAELEAEAG
ncbi:siderophore ferric iron reductase [Devosia sp. 1635]|uniref:siderophore ferric iron reductase n=1 Tax=Devosia sp. 1635 TaxID=2726066 RepID=UPI001567C3E9